jgi:hypothetical protein
VSNRQRLCLCGGYIHELALRCELMPVGNFYDTRTESAEAPKKVRAALGGEPPAREPGLGTGRGGDVTEFA